MNTHAAGPGDPNTPDTTPPDEPGVGLAKRDEVLPAEIGETSSAAVAAREKAAVEARYLKAMHNPRDFDNCRQRVLAMCRRPRFAEKVEYAKPVGGKSIKGLSIRFAEAAMMAWGNLDVRQVIVYEDRQKRTYRVAGTDLETNATIETDVTIEKFVERKQVRQGDEVVGSRTNSKGQVVYLKVATEDEILTKANAGIAKARRNIILALLPPDLKEEALELALDTVRDRDAKDPDAARKQIIDGFYRLGVMAAQLKEFVGKPLEQLSPAELGVLRQIWRAIDDGEATWQEVEEDEGLLAWRSSGGDDKGKKGNGADKGAAGLKEHMKGKATHADEDAAARQEEQADLMKEHGQGRAKK